MLPETKAQKKMSEKYRANRLAYRILYNHEMTFVKTLFFIAINTDYTIVIKLS